MFLTTPLTIAPSCSVLSSSSRSAPRLASSTARRETTTLLRFRSSLMTLNSRDLPSNGVVSLTGRMSTSEPGRNARRPWTITIRPPFTLRATIPETIVPFYYDDAVIESGDIVSDQLSLADLLLGEGFLEQIGEVFLCLRGFLGWCGGCHVVCFLSVRPPHWRVAGLVVNCRPLDSSEGSGQ